jgi:hypothetical protein
MLTRSRRHGDNPFYHAEARQAPMKMLHVWQPVSPQISSEEAVLRRSAIPHLDMRENPTIPPLVIS